MKARLEKLVKVYVTPAGLRTIADDLEKRFAETKLGEDVPFTTIYGTDIEVRLIVDQEGVYDERRLAERKAKQ